MGNEKGSGFEREQCRYLSLWWTNGKRDDVFWRNRVRATSKSPDARHQLGDIVAMDPVGAPFVKVFNVELKAGYSRTGKQEKKIRWDILDLIDGRGSLEGRVFVQFWKQVCTDADLSGREPMLIFKRDFRQPVVCVYRRQWREIEDYCGSSLIPTVEVIDPLGRDRVVLANRDDFFSWVTPECVVVLSKGKGEQVND